jgi:hypothetical protein
MSWSLLSPVVAGEEVDVVDPHPAAELLVAVEAAVVDLALGNIELMICLLLSR